MFEWDPRKERRNRWKHGVGFDEASTSFGDPLALVLADEVHPHAERRYILLGRSERDRLLVVVHMDLDSSIRIISARPATPRERRSYEQGT